MTNHIFISYSKKDSDFAHQLAEDLQAVGFKIWIDKQSISGGEEWRKAIKTNLETAEEVVVVLSPNAIESPWVNHEGSLAIGWKKRIIPVCITKVPDAKLPPWLDEKHYIDFIDTSHETAFDLLVDALTPPNPIQDLLDQQVQAYQQTGELIGEAILRVIDENIDGLIINAEAQELILHSALTYHRGQQWLTVLGANWLEVIRKTCLGNKHAQSIRLGAVALLGAMEDKFTFENLSLALENANNVETENALIDLLAQFLAKSSKHWMVKRKGKWAIFRRMAHLRIEDFKPERVRMHKVAIVLAIVSMLISFPTILIAAQQLEAQQTVAPYFDYNNENINYIVGGMILISIVFAIISGTMAYFFSEGLTRIDVAIKTWQRPWRALLMGSFGGLAGILLFFGISLQIKMCFAGSVIGLVLALFHQVPNEPSKVLRSIISLATSLLVIVIGIIILMPETVSWLQRAGSAISAGFFSGLYIYLGLNSSALGPRNQ